MSKQLQRGAWSDKDRVVIVAIGAVLSVVLHLAILNKNPVFSVAAPIGRDFVNFWLGGRMALQGHLAVLTEPAAYNRLVATTFHYLEPDNFVFSYPPNILPFLIPFGALPYLLSLAVWTGLNVLAIAVTVRQLRPDWRLSLAACLAPATAMMVIFGHFGGFFAWLATYALRRAGPRPILAGACLAAMSVKPQLAAVLGLILLAAGQWRALAWSIPMAAGLAVATLAAFGVNPWLGFIQVTLPYQTGILEHFRFEAVSTTVSVYTGLRRVGLGDIPAQVIQYALSAAIILRAGQLLRRGPADAATLLAALLAMIAASPYANHYDLAIAAPAMTVALLAPGAKGAPLTPIPALVFWVAPLFGMMTALEHIPIASVVVTAFTLYLLFLRPNRPDARPAQSELAAT